MADLVTAAEFADYLGLPVLDATAALLLDQVEAVFEAECGRSDRPFAAAATAERTERHDGTGTSRLYVDYPIATLTSVKLGVEVANPTETLDVADQTKLLWQSGERLLERIDGGVFGQRRTWSKYVTVVYTPAADLPVDVKPAIMYEAAVLYRKRGSEDASTEAEGGFRSDLVGTFRSEGWQQAVQRHGVGV